MAFMLQLKIIKAGYLISIFSLFLLSCQNIDQGNQGSVINRDAELALQNLFEIDPDTISIYKNAGNFIKHRT